MEAEAYDTRLVRSEARTYVHLPKCICQAAYAGNGLGRAADNSPNIQERSDAKVSRSAEGEAEAGAATSPSTVTCYMAFSH